MQSVAHPVMSTRCELDRLNDHVAAVQVSICPGGVPTGYTYFIPQEEHLESRVVTRAYMEAKMVVAMSGRYTLACMLSSRMAAHCASLFHGKKVECLHASRIPW